ncbi:unnamed protein product [Sympodiomycopsis kandeliae]
MARSAAGSATGSAAAAAAAATAARHHNNTGSPLANMDDIAADDDLLSDMLLDKLGFSPTISTHKMNPHYRSQRWNTEKLADMVRLRVMIERDIQAAVDELCKLPIIVEHLDRKSSRAKAAFQVHARRYLEAYLPDSGFEFAITNRYIRSINMIPSASSLYDASAFAESSATGAARNAAAAAAAEATSSKSSTSSSKTKPRHSHNIHAAVGQEGLKKDLCVVALRSFQPGEIIPCKGGFKDLSKEQDEALRNEANGSRGGLAHENTFASDGARDFSIIRSTRRNCTQVLLGPARFVNHDCDPNAQFYKTGSQMTFKVIQPIKMNEEILVLYGEHYFGINNSECMCATCEKRGTGVYDQSAGPPPQQSEEDKEGLQPTEPAAVPAITTTKEGPDGSIVVATNSSASEGEGNKTTTNLRAPSKRIKAAPNRLSPGGLSDTNGTNTPTTSRNDSPFLKAITNWSGADRIRFPPPSGAAPASAPPSSSSSPTPSTSSSSIRSEVFPSDREMLDPSASRGKLSRCLTCSAPFFTGEWYAKDECVRCERHFRIFQADYPFRKPTEDKWRRLFEKHESKVAAQSAANGNRNGTTSASGGGKSANAAGKQGKRKVSQIFSDGENDMPSASSGKKSRAKEPVGTGKRIEQKASKGNLQRGAAGSRSRRDAAQGTSPGADSISSSQASSPVHLTPLRPVKASQEEQEEEMPRKRSRKGVVDMDTDEDLIEQELSSRTFSIPSASTTTSAPSASVTCHDSDSELSDPPANTSDGETPSVKSQKLTSIAMAAGPSAESALSTDSSSGSDDRPCGPKMLGKDANVGNLAKHWGLQEGEGRRMRKPSVNGPVSLASKAGPSVKKIGKHRRTASASSMRFKDEADGNSSEDRKTLSASSPNKRSESRDVGSVPRSPTKPSSQIAAGRRGSAMSSALDEGSSEVGEGSSSALSQARPELLVGKTGSPGIVKRGASASPGMNLPADGIATHGTERTSISNLAKAWSAGTEGGRTRRQVVREPSLLSAVQRGGSPSVSAQQQRRSSASGSSGSRGGRGGRRSGGGGGGGGAGRSAGARAGAGGSSSSSSVRSEAFNEASRLSSSSSDDDRERSDSERPSPAPEDLPTPSRATNSTPLQRDGAVLPGSASSSNGIGINRTNSAPQALPPRSDSGSPAGARLATGSGGNAGSGSGSGALGMSLGTEGGTPGSAPKQFTHLPGRRNLRIARPASSSRPLAAVTGSGTSVPPPAVPSTSGDGWPGVTPQTSSPRLLATNGNSATSDVAPPAAANGLNGSSPGASTSSGTTSLLAPLPLENNTNSDLNEDTSDIDHLPSIKVKAESTSSGSSETEADADLEARTEFETPMSSSTWSTIGLPSTSGTIATESVKAESSSSSLPLPVKTEHSAQEQGESKVVTNGNGNGGGADENHHSVPAAANAFKAE